jgi:serine phosphatase RsbU (regulator of sigma subunit)
MKVCNTPYQDREQLSQFIDKHQLASYGNKVLAQVFCTNLEKEALDEVRLAIAELLPEAVIIGCSTGGNILNGKVHNQQRLIAFSAFEHTAVRGAYVERQGEDDYQMGVQLAKALVGPHTQAIILFCEGIQIHKELLLAGVYSQINAQQTVVVGGAAANINAGYDTLVMDSHRVSSLGAVGAALDGEQLRVVTGYELNWEPIGKILTVTDAEANRLISLDHQPAAQVMEHYLGKEVMEGGPATTNIFPLIIYRNNVRIARIAVTTLEDRSIYFTGMFYPGDRVQFSYGQIDDILQKNERLIPALKEEELEGLYLYSCIARKSFMQESVELESLPMKEIAPIAGFFTYGEFYQGDCSMELLNTTLTYLGLSEDTGKRPARRRLATTARIKGKANQFRWVLSALTNLSQTVTQELEASNSELVNANEELQALLEQVSAQNELIQRKNEDILDSIRYAQRIQTAILPEIKSIHQHLPQLFVYYQPRDIVSGDFYWFTHEEGISFIATVDCTGHGVPGAFMAVMGNNLLQRIVSGMNIHEPAAILTELDKQVRQSLKQDEGSGRADGMDIALCAIDHQAQVLRFAGANRPLFVFQGGELIEHMGTKLPIGDASYADKNFQSISIPLQAGQRFYLFSDGFVDQMGGDSGRKYSPKRFRELIESLKDIPIAAQEARFEQDFTAWKGKLDQLDDVCVIGFEW